MNKLLRFAQVAPFVILILFIGAFIVSWPSIKAQRIKSLALIAQQNPPTLGISMHENKTVSHVTFRGIGDKDDAAQFINEIKSELIAVTATQNSGITVYYWKTK